MPERKIAIYTPFSSTSFIDSFNGLLAEGWRLDKSVHNGVVSLENSVVYHLTKYSAEELQALQQAQEEKKSFSLKAVSLISVPLADVDAKLKEGYEIIPEKIYAKEAVLIKYAPEKAGEKQ